jgi:hypothetical protein
MTRPNKSAISDLLTEYAQLEARRLSVVLKRDRELAPLKAAYEKKAGPIVEASSKSISSIEKRLAVLAGDINTQLMSGVDTQAETVALPEVVVFVETTKAIAQSVATQNKADGQTLSINEAGKYVLRAIATVDAKPGNREIDPQELFNSVEPAKRVGPFWKMFKVLMNEADKVLGKLQADALAKKPKTYSTSISLKP